MNDASKLPFRTMRELAAYFKENPEVDERTFVDGNVLRFSDVIRMALAEQANDDLYERVEKWQRQFLNSHRAGHPSNYYADAASGLAIALQEIDRERYDRTSKDVWENP